ncbi:MAG TPA: hypothetical protein PKE12_02410 [Kiritimatiellia bacterium]|nr:hypothetical protein [Kiritimatiellia bacterium]
MKRAPRHVLLAAWSLSLGLCGAGAVEAPPESQQYFDDRFSFTIEYPGGWHAEIADENGDAVPDYVMKRSIYYKSHGPATFMIFVWSNREELDLISWFRANYLDLMSYPEEAPTEVNAEILGRPAVRFVNRQMTTCAMEITMFQYQDWVYMLLYRNCDEGASRPLFEHFVSSFTGAP